MNDWTKSLDRWLTTPPEEKESLLYCDNEDCGEPFYPGDEVYEIEGVNLCKECALKWLEEQARVATEEECYGSEEADDYEDDYYG